MTAGRLNFSEVFLRGFLSHRVPSRLEVPLFFRAAAAFLLIFLAASERQYVRSCQPSPGKDCMSKQHTATSKLLLSLLLKTLPFQIKLSSCWVSKLLHRGAAGPGDPAWELTAEFCQVFYFTGCNAFRKLPFEYIFNEIFIFFPWKRLTYLRFAANISSCLDEALPSRVKAVDGDAGWILGVQGWQGRSCVLPICTAEEQIPDLSEMLKKDCSDHQLHVSRLPWGCEGVCKARRERRCRPPAAIPPTPGLVCTTQELVSYTIRVAFNQETCNCI